MQTWTKKKWLITLVLDTYKGFLFVFFWSKLQESEKKNLELLSDIERLKKETEELRSEKGMATDIQLNNIIFHICGYILSIKCHLVSKIWYQETLAYKMWAQLLHGEMYPQLNLLMCTCISFDDTLEWVRYYPCWSDILFGICVVFDCQKTAESMDFLVIISHLWWMKGI